MEWIKNGDTNMRKATNESLSKENCLSIWQWELRMNELGTCKNGKFMIIYCVFACSIAVIVDNKTYLDRS